MSSQGVNVLFAFGVSHKTAPIALREQFAISGDAFSETLVKLHDWLAHEEVAMLSTCNRTEVYCQSESANHRISQWFIQHGIEQSVLEQSCYRYQGVTAVRHMMRVACGLDSMVLGEPQILGQVKAAYQTAKTVGSAGRVLQRLFETTFAVAKKIRTDTGIGRCPVSVSYAAVKLAGKVFDNLANAKVLLIGAGESIALCAQHLQSVGVNQMVFANRSLENAQSLATKFQGQVVALEVMHEILPHCDVIISAVHTPVPILGKGRLESALALRKHRPIFVVDLGMPRNIEPEVSQLEDVYLYALDDLREVVADNINMRQQEASQAEQLIDSQAHAFMQWLEASEGMRVIRDYRQMAFDARDEVLQLALQQINQGKPVDEVLQRFGHRLTNRLIHQPTKSLRNLAFTGAKSELERASEVLLGPEQDLQDKLL